ncbi:hypothetical protein NHX12_005826 [Muraenolepis orangiensis]|uniref:Uncharacterized protein n=1 Tax=Muraenolepis orangiensis TaxID=630683 RepID=A0A9Q0DVS1_9TELE|nr:hypothetical protein NHX12_005826 [Muraenolepis orangiensis]
MKSHPAEVPGKSWATIASSSNPERDAFTTIVKCSINEHTQEEEGKAARDKNLIIHRAPESQHINAEERKSHDASFIKELLEHQLNIPSVKFMDIIRLGAKKEGPRQVILADLIDKRKIMASLRNLKDATPPFNSISVGHDTTENERKRVNILVSQDKEKEAEDGTGTKYRVRGPPCNLKIVRLKPVVP